MRKGDLHCRSCAFYCGDNLKKGARFSNFSTTLTPKAEILTKVYESVFGIKMNFLQKCFDLCVI